MSLYILSLYAQKKYTRVWLNNSNCNRCHTFLLIRIYIFTLRKDLQLFIVQDYYRSVKILQCILKMSCCTKTKQNTNKTRLTLHTPPLMCGMHQCFVPLNGNENVYLGNAFYYQSATSSELCRVEIKLQNLGELRMSHACYISSLRKLKPTTLG